mgnify:CR=1 FL=1
MINQKYDRIPVTLREVYGFSKDVAKHLTVNYGTRALQVAELAKDKPALARRLNPSYPFLAAEVVFSAGWSAEVIEALRIIRDAKAELAKVRAPR